MPHCDMCGMHMPEGQITKHLQKSRCDRNTQMRCQRGEVEIAAKCTRATFSLTGDDRADCFEEVGVFKYIGQVLNRTENDCLAVLCNIWAPRKVLGRLWKLLTQESADTITWEKFYRAVVQTVLLFGDETWVLLVVMLNKLKGGTRGFSARGDGDKVTNYRGQDVDKGGVEQCASGGRNQTSEGIYQQEASNGSGVGGPLANIRGICKGDRIRKMREVA